MCNDDTPSLSVIVNSACASALVIAGASGPGVTSSRGPVTGVKGTQHWSLG